MAAFRFAAAACLVGLALATLLAEPAWAQSEPVKRLNWFWSIAAST